VRACGCGEQAERQMSIFTLKTYRHDRSDWELIAPLDRDGRAVTMTEAIKADLVGGYSRTTELGERQRAKEQQAQRTAILKEQAKRAGWKTHSRNMRIEVR